MLSGFLFDLRSMPAVVRVITYMLPARYYVTLLQTIFLGRRYLGCHSAECSGAGWHGGVFLFVLTRRATQKKLA